MGEIFTSFLIDIKGLSHIMGAILLRVNDKTKEQDTLTKTQ